MIAVLFCFSCKRQLELCAHFPRELHCCLFSEAWNLTNISAATKMYSPNIDLFFAATLDLGRQLYLFFPFGGRMFDNFSFKQQVSFSAYNCDQKLLPTIEPCDFCTWNGTEKRTGSLSNIWWYSASEHQVNWNENNGLHSPEQTYPTCEKGKGNSSSQPLSTNFGEDMLLPTKNLLICTLQNQKIQLIWFRRTSHQMFLNFPTRRRVLFFSACWESPHWMATSRSSGKRVVPRGFRRTMGDLFHTKRITVEVLPSWKISVKVEKDTFIQQGEHNTQR